MTPTDVIAIANTQQQQQQRSETHPRLSCLATLNNLVYLPAQFPEKTAKMGVNVQHHEEGTGAQPTPGQTVTIDYTGYLKDESKPDNKGNK